MRFTMLVSVLLLVVAVLGWRAYWLSNALAESKNALVDSNAYIQQLEHDVLRLERELLAAQENSIGNKLKRKNKEVLEGIESIVDGIKDELSASKQTDNRKLDSEKPF